MSGMTGLFSFLARNGMCSDSNKAALNLIFLSAGMTNGGWKRMAKVKFKLNRAGVRELLKSNEMMSICSAYADSSVNRLGKGYESDTHVGQNRVNAMVYTTTRQAKAENAKTNSILKSLKG